MKNGPLCALAAILLASCAVGPNYQHPSIPSTADAAFVKAAVPLVTDTVPNTQWWKLYDDAVLNRLIVDALAANTDLRVAIAHLEKARSQLRGARSALLPQTDVDGSVTEQRVPSWEVFPGTGRRYWSVDTGFDVGYEVDLFGRVRRSIQAARADMQAIESERDAVQLTVVSDTVREYLDATASSEQIVVGENTVALLDNSVRVTTARFHAGLAQKLDVMRITALRDQRRAALAPLQARRDAALFRLATLTGRSPRELPADVSEQHKLPSIIQPIPVGDGRSLISRRPDVRVAERRLAADTARIGVATADLYPNIVFTGSVGWTTPSLGDVFGAGPFRWLFGPAVSWSFPNSEAVRARIAGAKAETRASLASFDGTVLNALRETETALSAYSYEVERRTALLSARDQAQQAANVAIARQHRGTIDYLALLDAERTRAETEADLASSNARVAFAQVDLFRALAGGWRAADSAAVASR